jgi:hypothetical protein
MSLQNRFNNILKMALLKVQKKIHRMMKYNKTKFLKKKKLKKK